MIPGGNNRPSSRERILSFRQGNIKTGGNNRRQEPFVRLLFLGKLSNELDRDDDEIREVNGSRTKCVGDIRRKADLPSGSL